MTKHLSMNVTIMVETFYQSDYSNPLQHEFMHAYRITIVNHNDFPIQLLEREWQIFDTGGMKLSSATGVEKKPFNSACADLMRVVIGEGVVGMQPVIVPGDQYQYVSGCNLHSEIGRMYGHYVMRNMENKELFNVNIPTFNLIPLFKHN